MFALVITTLFIFSLVPRKTRRWLEHFDYLSDYISAAYSQFVSILWGESLGTGLGHLLGVAMPFLILAAYSQFQTPPSYVNWLAIVFAVLIAGYYVWRGDHVRLEKVLHVSLNHPPSCWPDERGDHTAYRLKISNISEGETIENIHVKLMSVQSTELNWLPIHLHLMHDNKNQDMESFSLNPSDVQLVDFVSSTKGRDEFSVNHTQHGVSHLLAFSEGCILEVCVTGENTPKLIAHYKVWKDNEGNLKCEEEASE